MEKAFIIDQQFANSENTAEVSGRALNDISIGNRLSIVKENITSIYTVRKLEAYRKSIETLYEMYGGIIWMQLSEGPECDFNKDDILFFE